MSKVKVKCRFCQFEEDSKCTKKKLMKIKLNKSRKCDFYKEDEDRVLIYEQDRRFGRVESVERPDWYWDKKKRKEIRRRMVEQEMSKYGTTADEDQSSLIEKPETKIIKPGSSHPLTGDLSRFTSSAN